LSEYRIYSRKPLRTFRSGAVARRINVSSVEAFRPRNNEAEADRFRRRARLSLLANAITEPKAAPYLGLRARRAENPRLERRAFNRDRSAALYLFV